MGEVIIRPALAADLPEVNQIITDAVMAWPLAERVKRLAVPVVTYSAVDLQEYELLMAQVNNEIAGVAAWQPLPEVLLRGKATCLLHGLYVAPSTQKRGIGTVLLKAAGEQAARAGAQGLLLKAERVAVSYFEHQGLERLGEEAIGAYPYQFWQALPAS